MRGADRLIQWEAEEGRFSGVVLIERAGRTVYSRSVGAFDGQEGRAIAADDSFRIGCITKQFTAAMLLQLEAEGRVSLSDPLLSYLPEVRRENLERDGVCATLRHCLESTAGLPSFRRAASYKKTIWKRPFRSSEVIDMLRSTPLDFRPGSEFRYSMTCYWVLGLVIERVSGSEYVAELKRRILDPLGLVGTGVRPVPGSSAWLTGGAMASEAGPLVSTRGHFAADPEATSLFAAGSMFSNTGDLLRWIRALSQGTLFARPLAERMMTPGLGQYGYGLIIWKGKDGKSRYWHNGNITGYSSDMLWIPENKEVFLILQNRDRRVCDPKLIQKLKAVYDKESAPRLE